MNGGDATRYRLAAVWFADIVGYSDLADRDEPAALARVRAFQESVREVVSAGEGRVVKFLGDGAIAEFPHTIAAVESALALSEAVRSRDPGAAIRVGVHVGDVASTPDGDLYGGGINLAARLQAEGAPGQVVASEEVWNQIRRHPTFEAVDLGSRHLKGMGEVRLRALRRRGEAPAPGRAGAEVAVPAEGTRHRRKVLAAIGVGVVLAIVALGVGTRLWTSDRGGERPAVAPDTALVRERSIAVLPLENLSADPENEYFSDGVTEEILTALSRIEGLKVISRTSVMAYKDTQKTLKQIASELGVAHVLEGSVRREGNRVRVSVQLIDAATDEHLWSESYDRELTDIFAIQSDIASQIAGALEARLSEADRARLAEAPTANLQAYELYLRGRFFWNKRTEADLRRALEHYEEALELDPGFALAHAGVAETWAVMPSYARVTAEETVDISIAAAERALELDPNLGQAYAALGLAHLNGWNWEASEQSFRRAIELNPGYASAHQWYALYLAAVGRTDQAIAEMVRARELDPLSLIINTEVGLVYFFARRYDEAIVAVERALELDPAFPFAHELLASTYEAMGQYDQALASLERLGSTAPGNLFGLGAPDDALRRAYAERGPQGYWRKQLEVARARDAPPGVIGRLYSRVGDLDEAFRWLERGIESRDFVLTFAKVDPDFDPLRSDPRFDRLLERMDLPRSGR